MFSASNEKCFSIRCYVSIFPCFLEDLNTQENKALAPILDFLESSSFHNSFSRSIEKLGAIIHITVFFQVSLKAIIENWIHFMAIYALTER